MKTNTKIIIGASAAILIAGGIILSINLSKKRKIKKACKSTGGKWDNKSKTCLSSDGSVVVVEEQTKNDIGKTVNVHPTLKYTNVRSSPKIDNGIIQFFGIGIGGNLLGKVTSSPVGVISQVEKGDDDYNWYKINLSKPLNDNTSGYVREDAISFT
tara:strand:- start:1142 stop:1609 length:468 start_codon:yes stop_codon:yes gene_type:complete